MTILIVGLGSIARKHIMALRILEPEATIYALRSTHSSLPQEGVRDIYSLEELADVQLDFVIVSNPTSEHKKTIEQLANMHCALFIEKPLYHLLDIERLVCDLEKSGRLTYVACNLRFLDCMEFVKKELSDKQKRVNEVNAYCGSFLPDWRQGVDFRAVYSAIPSMGGGVHLDLIHELDYLYWFFGVPHTVHSVFSNRSSLSIDSYDYANFCLEYDDFSASVILNYFRRDSKRTLEFVLDDETWTVDLLTNKVTCVDRLLFSSEQTIQATYLKQMDYFLHLVRSDKRKSCNTIADAFNVLKICLNNDTER